MEKNLHLNILNLPIYKHGIPLCLFSSPLISLFSMLLFSSDPSCAYLVRLTPKYLIVGANINVIVVLISNSYSSLLV